MRTYAAENEISARCQTGITTSPEKAMKATRWLIPALFALGSAASAWAADARPADATGQCKDGTYTNTHSHQGACSDHGGVKTWFSEAGKSAASTATSTTPTTSSPSTTSAPTHKTTDTAMAGGGAGKVWVNTKSKVYHCQGDRWYGKTKHGEYMTEAEAKAHGAHADHGKACTA
jgi:hypothetical protein